MSHKKLIPGFGCKNGRALVRASGLAYDSNDILTLSRYFNDNGADGLFIHDLSETEADHEKTIGIVKEAARAVDVPIILGGRVKRLEDVKKYLYAGAKAVFLDVSDEDNLDLIKEASDRFGSEKIYVYLPDMAYLSRAEEFEQLGASMMILDVPALDREQLHQISLHQESFLLVSGVDGSGTINSYLSTPSVEGIVLDFPHHLAGSGEGDCMKMKQELKAGGIEVATFESEVEWKDFKLNSDGMIPVIVQDYKTSEVLMLAYMNEEAFYVTLQTGKMTYYSRSRQELWIKGDTSGHYQYVKSLKLDCDQDTILAKVNQVGAACHTGAHSCFFQTLAEKEYKETNPLKVFEDVFSVILDRKEHPKEGSYTNYLFDKGIDKILKKVGEEATEIVIAAKNPDPEEIKYEISDFLYHVMVLMAEKGVSWEEITQELANR